MHHRNKKQKATFDLSPYISIEEIVIREAEVPGCTPFYERQGKPDYTQVPNGFHISRILILVPVFFHFHLRKMPRQGKKSIN